MSYHTMISFYKSALRIGGFICLLHSASFGLGVGTLIVAEVLGILEEFKCLR